MHFQFWRGTGLDLVRSAIRRYREANLRGMVAVAEVLEGWLLTQSGKKQSASQSWSAAFSFLRGTEDWTLLATILAWRGRDCCRADLEEEGRSLLLQSIVLHNRVNPPHRNLSHIYTDLADLELRMASKHKLPEAGLELWNSACAHIKKAESLLEQDSADHRNWVRLRLAQANQALLARNPNFYTARLKAGQAYAVAKAHDESLMIGRALYKQAVVEKRAAENANCDDPVRRLLKACRYGLAALERADGLHSDRLAARIHTLLGNVFLAFPFCDPEYASQHWEAAVERMREHEDFDYVVKEISMLGEKLETCRQVHEADGNTLIIAVSEDLAFGEWLETKLQVERAIILTAVKCVGPSSRAIAELLRTGRRKVEKILLTKNSEVSPVDLRSHHVIFRVKTALAFSQPLHMTIKAVERAIILAAWIRYGCDRTEVKDRLHIGFEKIVSVLGND